MNILNTAIDAAANSANPYLLAIKIGSVVVVAGLLIWAGVWFKGVLDERSTLAANAERMASDVLDANHRADMAVAAQKQYQQTLREVVDAVRKIKIKSSNYINTLETAPAPDVADGDSMVLVPGGMPDLDAAIAMFTQHSTSRATPGAQTSAGNQAR